MGTAIVQHSVRYEEYICVISPLKHFFKATLHHPIFAMHILSTFIVFSLDVIDTLAQFLPYLCFCIFIVTTKKNFDEDE